MKLSEELTWRGFVNQTTYVDVKKLDENPVVFYWGVDPSANSMQVGQLGIVMMIKHLVKAGHKPILLVGGATGLIGDPDGKDEERSLKSEEEVEINKKAIASQYEKLLGNNLNIVDNYEWFKAINYLNFLRDIGKHVPMRQMLGREFVQSRLSEKGNGISYAEFSYSLIQGYDFLHLYKNYNVTLQICGADQWGNSIAGVELIRRIEGQEAHILSAPLIINKSTGIKFGKSEEGAIWLDETLTSVYKFYQFWLNLDDEGVEDYLKIYTELSKEEIEHVIEEFNQNRASRIAQKTLAYEVTKTVHGAERAESVKRQSEVLFSGDDYEKLTDEDFRSLAKELPLVENATDLISAIVKGGLARSNSEARRFIDEGGIYINGNKVAIDDVNNKFPDKNSNYLIIRRGKNNFAIVKN